MFSIGSAPATPKAPCRADMKNMKSIIFDHWRHRGLALEAKLSEAESNVEDSDFHVFKSAALQLHPESSLQSGDEKHEINDFDHWRHRG